MSGQDILATVLMTTCASLVADKFKTRERFAIWFAGLKLTRPKGYAISFFLVIGTMLLTYLFVLLNANPNNR